MDELEFLWKDINSGGNGCPALIKGDGGYYVQGVVIGADKRAELQAISDANQAGLNAGEDVVFVPANVLDRLRS
jgi:hypothetical protein